MKCSDKVKKKFAEYPQFNPWVYPSTSYSPS